MSDDACIFVTLIALLTLVQVCGIIMAARKHENEFDNRRFRDAMKIAQLRQQLVNKPTYTSTYYPPNGDGKREALQTMVEVGIITAEQANAALEPTHKKD